MSGSTSKLIRRSMNQTDPKGMAPATRMLYRMMKREYRDLPRTERRAARAWMRREWASYRALAAYGD